MEVSPTGDFFLSFTIYHVKFKAGCYFSLNDVMITGWKNLQMRVLKRILKLDRLSCGKITF